MHQSLIFSTLSLPAHPKHIVTGHPHMRFGMSSDWGAAADWKDPQSWIKSKMHTVCRVGSIHLLATLTTNQGTLQAFTSGKAKKTWI
jgi:hypothetical protein